MEAELDKAPGKKDNEATANMKRQNVLHRWLRLGDEAKAQQFATPVATVKRRGSGSA